MNLKLISLLILSTIWGKHLALAQQVAVKTNVLYWVTTSINGALEFATSKKITLELAGAYNPWTFKDDKKMRFWLAQPELKYWFYEKFKGHFIGVHLHGAQFFGGFRDRRYDGYLAGGGFSYGYDWRLAPHWNLEAEIGLGYAYLWYKESPRIACNTCRKDKHRNYYGPTKASLSISYIF